MRKISVREAAKAMMGRCITGDPNTLITGVTTDSRAASGGMLFFALKGERFDAHDFLEEALSRGCSALAAARMPEGKVLKAAEEAGACVILTEDTLTALQELAAYYLSLFSIKRIGVTGSTGKTSTKEMLALILSERYSVISNAGNLNNLIGLPLTAFRVEDDTEAAVFEMGMDRLGEIHRLGEIARPQVGVITNIGLSHIERLKSRENILLAKLEIIDFMEDGGVLVVNGDDDLLSKASYPSHIRILRAGQSEDCDFRISGAEDQGERGIRFSLTPAKGIWNGGTHLFSLTVPGLHNAANAALAIGAAACLGITPEEAQRGLARFAHGEKRQHIIEKGGIKIIDDTYNASPDSMRAAIKVLAAIEGTRKLAVLGDMFELGERAEEYHRQIGEYASQAGIDVVISVGKNASHISRGAREGGIKAIHFETKDNLAGVLTQWIRSGDAILVKGSRGMAMEEIVELLERIAE